MPNLPSKYLIKDSLYIPGEVPSKKNSKRIWWKNGAMKGPVSAFRGGRPVMPFITSSGLTTDYEKAARVHFMQLRRPFHILTKGLPKPYFLAFHFIRKTRRQFDFVNMCQVLLDMMQEENWIADDTCDDVLPLPMLINGKTYTVDKEYAGVVIKIIKQ